MKVMKAIIKVMRWTIIVLLAFVVLSVLAIQTRPVKNTITRIAQTELNKMLNARLHIKSIDGNFFTKLRFNDVLLTYENDTIGFIPELKLRYKLLPLLKGDIIVSSVEINNPLFSITQYKDSTWIFQYIVKPSEKPHTVSKPFGMELNIEKIYVTNAAIRFNTPNATIPRTVTNFNTDLTFRFSRQKQEINMRQLRFTAHNPDLILEDLTFNAKRDTTLLQLSGFKLRTSLNQIDAEAHLYSKEIKNSYLKLTTSPIHTEEFGFLFPQLNITAHPATAISGYVNDSLTTLHISLKDENQKASIQIISDNLARLITKKSNQPLQFILKGDIENLNLREWIDNPAADNTFSGTFIAEGAGIDPKKMHVTLNGDLNNLTLLKRRVNTLIFKFIYDIGNLKGTLDASGSFGSIHIAPEIQDIWETDIKYRALINTKQLDLSKLMLDKTLKSNLTMNAGIAGQGFDPKTLTAKINAKFNATEIFDFNVETLDVNLNYLRADVSGTLSGKGDFGQIFIAPDIRGLLSKNPSYTAHIVTEKLNLAPLLSNDSLSSDLNLISDIKGNGFDLRKMNLHASLFAFPSTIMGVNIRKLAYDISYFENNINIHSLLLNTQTIALSAQGNYSLNSVSDINLNVDMQNASEISGIIRTDSLEAKGTLQANLSGRPDNLQAMINFELDDIMFRNYTAEKLSGQASGLITGNDTLILADIFAGNVRVAGIAMDSIKLHTATDTRSADVILHTTGKDIHANLTGNINLKEDILIRLDTAEIGYKGSDWRLIESPASISIAKNEYQVNELKFISDNGNKPDSAQIFYANGVINRSGDQHFDLKLSNLDISSALTPLDITSDIQGSLNMSLYLRGHAETPVLEGGFNIDNAMFNDYRFSEFAGTVDLSDKKLKLDAGIVPQDSGSVNLTGFIPFDMRLDSMKFITPTTEDSVNLDIAIDKIPLRIARVFYPFDEISGYIQSHISVNGTIGNPNPVGMLQIVDGKLELKQYGINYNKMLAVIRFEKETVAVDSILIRSRSGSMLTKGTIGFGSQFYKGDIRHSDIDITFNKFQPLNHKYYNMQMSGNVALHGKKDSLYFDGDVNILEALVYLPAVMNIIGQGERPDIPMPVLISELERTNQIPDSVILNFRTDTVIARKISFDYFDNLEGSMKVFIPRNTWVKNEQMRFELAGDINIVKHKSLTELFGSVDIIRGQYELLGKTFTVDEGAITFQGGKDFNPNLNIVASYNIRGENTTNNKLTINITGNLKEPVIRFTMGGEQLNEGDALSYILFGVNMDALTSGQNAAITTGTAGSIATGAAASILSSELTKVLGKTLNVDFIEMRAGSSFENATVVIGKYITNKLFMSYTRRFGDFKDEHVAEYEMKLEYELFRFLFLQLAGSPINNGIDLIFKVNSKDRFKK